MMGVDTGITGTTGAASVQSPTTSEGSASQSQPAGGSGESTSTASETSGSKEAAKSKGLPPGFGKSSGKTLAGGPAADAAAAETPSYVLNPKFKVLDKELEFDEWAKSAVKDAETEKKVRELYEKAHGLDSVKQDRQTLKSELAETKERIASTDRAIEQISQYANKKDWDSFFEALRIPKDEILKYAIQVAQREQMPPEQRQAWENQRRQQQEAQQYQAQNQTLMQQHQQLQVEQREFQLQMVLSKPEIGPVVEAYNAGMANPGAFREFVVRMGQAYAASGQDISVEQAVQEAVRHLKAANPQLGIAPATVATPATSRVVQPSGKQTLPNIQGRGTSPVKTVVRTFDDLKNRAREING